MTTTLYVLLFLTSGVGRHKWFFAFRGHIRMRIFFHPHDRPAQPLGMGCQPLDDLLDQGLRPGITELCGESASGKTQLVLQLLLQVCISYRSSRACCS